MTLGEKHKLVLRYVEECKSNTIKDILDDLDKTGRLWSIYKASDYSLYDDNIDSPKILLINLLYKLIKKNDDSGEI